MRCLRFIAEVMSSRLMKMLMMTILIGVIGRHLEAAGYMRMKDFMMTAILVLTIQNQFELEKITRHIDNE